MKILHINSYFGERFFYDGLYKKQIEKGNNIVVYVSLPMGASKEVESLGDYIFAIEDHKRWHKYFYHLKVNEIIQSIINTVIVEDFDLIHAHSWYTNGYVAMKLSENFNKKYVITIRNGDVNLFYKKIPFLRHIGHRILFSANKIIFLSESYREMVLKELLPRKIALQIREKCFVIPNGIDDFWHNNLYRGRKRLDTRKVNALFVGEITYNKNIEKTIEALIILKERGYDVSYTVVGEIKDKGLFKRIIKCDFLEYKKKKKKEDLINEYRQNNVFVMPSKTEAFGLVYAEAMTQAMPVIYTKGQGFYKQFDEGVVGYAVQSFNAIDIADKIEKIFDDYDSISNSCVELSRKFTWTRIEEELEEIYESKT